MATKASAKKKKAAKKAGKFPSTPAGKPTVSCKKKVDPKVFIGRVRRGNPYRPKNARAKDGMPDSVPPRKTYRVKISVTPTLEATSNFIALSVINTSADNGDASVTPSAIIKTSWVMVTGVTQTKPGHGGQLKIQAKLDGKTVKAESAGFTVCAHPINYRDPRDHDIDDGTSVGLAVADDWDSDSGVFADLDEAEDSEVVSYVGKNDSPPFPARGAVPFKNSGYQPANQRTVDSHTMGRADIQSGPKGITEALQLCIFKCHRCGATDKVHPRSGFKRIHEVFKDGTKWKHRTKKIGFAVKIGAYKTKAGVANAVSDDHDLP